MKTEVIKTTLATEHKPQWVIKNTLTGHSFKIDSYTNLGRSSSCQIFVAHDPFISSRHLRIEHKNCKLIAQDLNSSNGSFLNGQKMIQSPLEHGDILTLGQTAFEVIDLKSSLTTNKNLVNHENSASIISSTNHSSTPPSNTFEQKSKSKYREPKAPSTFHLQSKNPSWALELSKIPTLAKSRAHILILGPTGSGKEVIANSIHNLSNRKQNHFLALNCSALTSTLIESALFGHIKGSFTGATEDRKGAFRSAHGGTLFLDEIGDLPLELQPKLLRALECGEVQPVGSDKIYKVDTRILSATHKNIEEKILDKSFREDLFYRLQTFQINIPALKDRKEDFEDLFFNFCRQYKVSFSASAIKELKNQEWPGNIRELKQVIERGSILFSGIQIQTQDLELIINKSNKIKSSFQKTKSTSALTEMEKMMIQKSLIQNNRNIRKTASDLNIPKSTLHDKVKRYGL